MKTHFLILLFHIARQAAWIQLLRFTSPRPTRSFQQSLASRARSPRRQDRDDDGQRFPRRPEGIRVVIPVPTFLERDQIHIADKALIEHLDAYSAPRLVEISMRSVRAELRR
jgi:hypothetical protein